MAGDCITQVHGRYGAHIVVCAAKLLVNRVRIVPLCRPRLSWKSLSVLAVTRCPGGRQTVRCACIVYVAATTLTPMVSLTRATRFTGTFVWSGFDYRGEPTLINGDGWWPAVSSSWGLLDLVGFKKVS